MKRFLCEVSDHPPLLLLLVPSTVALHCPSQDLSHLFARYPYLLPLHLAGGHRKRVEGMLEVTDERIVLDQRKSREAEASREVLSFFGFE